MSWETVWREFWPYGKLHDHTGVTRKICEEVLTLRLQRDDAIKDLERVSGECERLRLDKLHLEMDIRLQPTRDLDKALKELAASEEDRARLRGLFKCSQCGAPAITKHRSLGEGEFWLCGSIDADHDFGARSEAIFDLSSTPEPRMLADAKEHQQFTEDVMGNSIKSLTSEREAMLTELKAAREAIQIANNTHDLKCEQVPCWCIPAAISKALTRLDALLESLGEKP